MDDDRSDWLRVLTPVFAVLRWVKLEFPIGDQDECPAFWSRAFQHNTSILHLDLSWCDLRDAKITTFAGVLPTSHDKSYLS
jgi:hypothetical protein